MYFGKRLFDVVSAFIGLLILSPLFLFVAIWIKLDSRGPFFYRQERVGLKGKTFRIHKFRTMRLDADKQGLQITVGVDPRITPSGFFLRKYKIDELPQLIDVLAGSMSIVGPRPEVPRYVQCYSENLKTKALSVRPGITDKASIEFKDENDILAKASNPEQEYIDKIIPIKLAYHVEYANNASFAGDLKLIFRTLKAIFVSR